MIEIYSLLNYSEMRYILPKQKLLMIQPNIYIYIYISDKANTLGNGTNPLILPAMG